MNPVKYLDIEILNSKKLLEEFVYSDISNNYYWSDNFSAEYFIAQAKAGFIAVTDTFQENEILIPEIQFDYAVLDLNELHVSKKVTKLINSKKLEITIDQNIKEIGLYLDKSFSKNWLSKKYRDTLMSTLNLDSNFEVISCYIKENGIIVAGEIGYKIGKTYTSLSGFSNREKKYSSYGTAQLVLLAKYLKNKGFSFWNLGHPYMKYKFDLGAKSIDRKEFLKKWYKATNTK